MFIFRSLFLSILLALSFVIPSSTGTKSISKPIFNAPSQEFYINDTYDFGDIFEVPTLVIDNITYDSTVEFPDGTATRLKTLNLNQIGTYYVHYTAYQDGKYYSKDYSFIVRNTIFSFSGNKSRAAYGAFDENYNIEGLYVSLAAGETFTYNKIIDLRNLTRLDKIFKVFVCPSAIGTLDFQYLYFTFTDIEDPTSQMTISAHQSNEGLNAPYTYMTAKGKNQEFAGIEHSNGRIHRNNPYGQPINHSFYGYYPSGTPIGFYSINASYNAASKEVYTNDMLTIGFLNPNAFDTLWDGFVSGKVILSITAGSYLSDYASFNIMQLMDFDLSNVNLNDFTAPTIDVSLPSTGPVKAKVGYNYPIYKATAKDDISSKVKLNTYVYYHRSSSPKVGTLVNHDGNTFKVEKEGVYSIVYEAVDSSNNVATEIIKVPATKDELPIYIFPASDPLTTIKQGYKYYFPDYIISGGAGGGFDKTITVTKNGVEIENNGEYFVPREVGTYRIKMTAIDLIGQRDSYFYNVEVTANEGAMFYDTPVLPKYFLSESKYVLPELYAIDYGDNSKEVLADVQIEYGSHSETIKSGEPFRPIADTHKQVAKLTYKYKDASLEFNVPIMRVYEGITMNIVNYFDLNNLDLEVNQTNPYTLATAENNGDASWAFANPILSSELNLDFGTVANQVKYEKIRLTLQDKENDNQTVSVEILPRADGFSTLKANGDDVIFGFNFYEENEDKSKLSITYKDGRIYVNGAFVNITKYDNGEDFVGFSSEFVYVSGAMVNALAGAQYKILKFDNQTIRQWAADNNPPKMIILGEKGGYKPFGSLYTMAAAKFGDVLDPNIDASVTVHDPDGLIVKDINGLSLEEVNPEVSYTFKLEKYGQYIVEYLAKDTSNKKFADQYAVGVIKENIPQIEITSSYETSVELGHVIIAPNYKINYDGDIKNVKSYIIVKSPNGYMIALPKGYNSYLPRYEGIYEVSIHAVDMDGNSDTFKYQVDVHK